MTSRRPQRPRRHLAAVARVAARPRVSPAALLAAAVVLLALAAAARAQTPPHGPAYDAAFDATWRDGTAELASYDLTYPRYTEQRIGTAVTVVVTEPFNDATRVKSDTGGPGTFGVLKLNLAEDFPTGVYDYNLMTSAFVATQPTGGPSGLAAGDVAKLSFSSQEWCGHAWEQAAFRPQSAPGTVARVGHSYFETEGDTQTTLEHPAHGFAEDALILWARGLAGPAVTPGTTVTLPLYRSMAIQRLRHVPAAWDTATLARSSATQSTATVTSDIGDRTYHFTLNAEGQLQKLERSDGYTLTLRGVERLPYWNQHNNADQKRLSTFGLEPRGPGRM